MLTLSQSRITGQKPPMGAELDRSHPLAQAMYGCFIVREGTGSQVYNLADPRNSGAIQFISQGYPKWQADSGIGGSVLHADPGFAVFNQTTTRVPGILARAAGGPITLVMRAKATTSPGASGFALWESDGRTLDFFIYQTSQFNFIVNGTGSGQLTSTVTWANTGEWHQWSIVYDGATYWLYVDDKLGKTGSLSGGTAYTATLSLAGRGTSGATQDWMGQWSYAYVYGRKLLAGEIASLYRSPFQMVMPAAPERRFWFMNKPGGDPFPAGYGQPFGQPGQRLMQQLLVR